MYRKKNFKFRGIQLYYGDAEETKNSGVPATR